MRVRGVLPFLGLLLVVPTASAEWGVYGEDGWPINVDGESTNPYPGHVATPGMEPLNELLGFTVYPYWPILTAEVQRLALEYPDLVTLHSIGKSTLGLDLWMLEIADFANPDMLPLEQREVVWVDGGTHSNEYSGVYFVLHLANFLIEGYGTNETATWIVENRHTWIMPMVNPDGSNLFGRLNAHLVNINRNYPVVWDGQGHDELMNNRGPAPASEVETQLNIEWFNKTKPDYYASVHCCGNLWLYPYGEEGVDPLDNATFARVCQEAFPTVVEDCGPIWSTIYPASGSSVDTAYEYTGAVAFGYEMSGRGAISLWGQPITEAPVEEQEFESWNGILHAFLNVHRYGGFPVVEDIGVEGDDLRVTLRNDGYGPISEYVARVTPTTTGGSGYGTHEDGLPPIAPGHLWTVKALGPFPAGEAILAIEYTKRLASGPEGVVTVPLVFEDSAGQLTVRVAGGNGPRVVEPALPGERDVPAPSVLAALLLVVGAIFIAARRARV